ncbi:YbaN family protein [bacterium]|nr:YbaN family protein [bacterium]
MQTFTRTVLLGLGFLCVALGLIGVFLPVLPTTPFILLAAYFLARSSPRSHAWLRHNRWFGKTLRDWESGEGLTLATKWRIAILATLFIGISFHFCPSAAGKIALVLVWPIPIGVAAFTKTKRE